MRTENKKLIFRMRNVKLRDTLKEQGISWSQFAKILEVDENYVKKWFQFGAEIISDKDMENICKVLRVSQDFFDSI
ncbi:MAG: helix-turn-helix transcriptional regulator [Elusimicrobiota bacterium]|jgi:transcriptional regulator with XRE-family HTH domain|nr:helix-turn-helix transcriptional regulator [Elusimicrobiota bacterium]